MKLYYQTPPDNHILVTYYLESATTLAAACEGVAIGQTIGNPNTRIPKWETPDLVEKYAAKIIANKIDLEKVSSGTVIIAFPVINFDWKRDGISHLLCVLLGGQADIGIIKKCHVVDIDDKKLIPKLSPKFGLSGLRKLTNRYNRPLLGCIIKPKIGLSPGDYATIVSEIIEGGADIIKEDEILGTPAYCSLEERLEIVSKLIKNRNVVYLTTINGDADSILKKAKLVSSYGINGVHINVWSGLGTYSAVRKLDLPVAIHYQKSGDKAFTHEGNAFRFAWPVLCKLAAWSGVDTIHAGMWGGYLSDDPDQLKSTMDMLTSHNVVPALSCGMNADLIPKVTQKFGCDYLANVGSACHSHPNGVYEGVKLLRGAIDDANN